MQTKVMLKMQTKVMLKIQRCRAQNAETSCSKCKTQNNAHYVFTVQYMFYLIPTLAEVKLGNYVKVLVIWIRSGPRL